MERERNQASGQRMDNQKLWHKMKGKLPIPMKNDYLFKAMLQRNEKVLKALIASVLHMETEMITTVKVENPIVEGASFGEKTFILDVKVTVNHRMLIDIEMQVLREEEWPERSLVYLCRAFDNLNKGDEYMSTKPAVQVGFLDFTLFEDDIKFFSEYRLLDTRTQKEYTDKFRICVINLKQAGKAAEEEKKYRLDEWAAMFAATTWEELSMVAQNNPAIDDAVETAYTLTMDKQEYYRMEAREITRRHELTVQRKLARLAELENVEDNLKEAKTALEQTERNLEQTERNLEQTERDLEQTERDLEQTERNLEQTERNLEQARKEQEQAEKERTQARKELEEAREKNSELEAKIEKLTKLLEKNGLI